MQQIRGADGWVGVFGVGDRQRVAEGAVGRGATVGAAAAVAGEAAVHAEGLHRIGRDAFLLFQLFAPHLVAVLVQRESD